VIGVGNFFWAFIEVLNLINNIHWEFIQLYTPHQNGVSECKNETFLEKR
jgi:hypothetical protein